MPVIRNEKQRSSSRSPGKEERRIRRMSPEEEERKEKRNKRKVKKDFSIDSFQADDVLI